MSMVKYLYVVVSFINELIGNADIERFIKRRRIALLGHVMRMDDKKTPTRILQWKPIGTRTSGRPRKRWIAGIEEDLQIMGVRRWRRQCEERAEWKRITEKAKTHSGFVMPVKEKEEEEEEEELSFIFDGLHRMLYRTCHL
jgi:hypothetical protein